MNGFDAKFVERATGGRWVQPVRGDLVFRGVSIDSREEQDGRLFIAIRGDVHDGHDHVSSALARGAAAAMVERWPASDGPTDSPVLQVASTRAALTSLARAWRDQLVLPRIIAITGTCGKTTTKTMLNTVLGQTMSGTCAPKSFNNEIGVPLTLLAASPDDAYVIIEIGTNHPGEIETLTRLAQPDVAVITLIGRGHLEGLGTVEKVAEEKAGILREMKPRGMAVVNGDMPLLRPYLRGRENVLRFGSESGNDLQLTGRGPLRTGGQWLEANGSDRFELALAGRHNALNALAVIAIARSFGLVDEVIQRGLLAARPAEMRQAVEMIDGVQVMNDAYNANPESMSAAFDTFAEVSQDAERRLVVLGDMLELGEEARSLHTELGRRLLALHEQSPLMQIHLIGPLMRYTEKSATQRLGKKLVRWYEKPERDVLQGIVGELKPGDAVLLKGSRRIGIERIVKLLKDRAPANITSAE